MIERHASLLVKKYATQFPVVTITGPRQSGKTTLCRSIFQDKPYVSLENPEERRFASEDPKGFLAQFEEGAIIDEVQRQPELFSYIQTIVDEKKQNGFFILTGSQQFEMMEKITQSLAGRTAIVRLLPFQYSEIASSYLFNDLDTCLFTGFYPRIFDQSIDPTDAMRFYLNTYVERDVRLLINIKDISVFEVFLKILAGRSGQLLNTNSLGNECGVSHNTVRSWISVLEASYIIKLVRPYYRNVNKRLVKMPKMFFLDTGLLCYLLNIYSSDQLFSHPLRGSIFETFVFAELLKQHYNSGTPENIYFFRDYQGNEVDFLLEKAQSIDLIEVKSSATFNGDFLKGINYFEKLFGFQEKQTIVYGGEKEKFQYKNVTVMNWQGFQHYLDQG